MKPVAEFVPMNTGRAVRHTAQARASARPPAAPVARPDKGGMVSFRVRSSDPRVAFRVMATHTLVPGLRRAVHHAGNVIYVRTVEPALTEMPRIYEFLAHFQSSRAAAILAQRLEADLEGTAATLEIRRVEVPLESEAIRQALMEAVAEK